VSPESGFLPVQLAITLDEQATAGLDTGDHTAIVTVESAFFRNGKREITVNFKIPVRHPARPGIGRIASSASLQSGPVAPGELISIFGRNLAQAPPQTLGLGQDGSILTTLAGTTVTFDGTPAALMFVSPEQINAIVPYEIGGRQETTVVVRSEAGASDPTTLAVAETSPAMFTANQTGSGPGAFGNEDSTVNGLDNPAAPGSVVVIFATGGGALEPPALTASLTSPIGPFPTPAGAVRMTIGGLEAELLFAGGAPGLVSGMLQLNVKIPDNSPTGELPVVLTIGPNSSPPVTVAVRMVTPASPDNGEAV
jgi:uncharacterized protein (TIGR03437 family)